MKERFEIPLSKLLTPKQFSEVERSCRIAEDAINDPQTYRFYRSNPELFAERYGIPIEKLDSTTQNMELKVIDALTDEDLRSHARKEDLPRFLKKLQEKGILPDKTAIRAEDNGQVVATVVVAASAVAVVGVAAAVTVYTVVVAKTKVSVSGVSSSPQENEGDSLDEIHESFKAALIIARQLGGRGLARRLGSYLQKMDQ